MREVAAGSSRQGAFRPLAGIRVVEFSQLVMGPTCGLILADLGADVVKVEPIEGDRTRVFKGPASGFFANYCRNKRSLAVDTAMPAGQEVARRLIEKADVLIENFRPGLLERFGLDYDSVAAFAPHVVYCSLKGYLPGPYEHRLALDEVVQMMGGLAYMTGLPDRPMRVGASVNDVMGGMFGVIAIQAALTERQHDGARPPHPERAVREQRLPDRAGDDVRDGDGHAGGSLLGQGQPLAGLRPVPDPGWHHAVRRGRRRGALERLLPRVRMRRLAGRSAARDQSGAGRPARMAHPRDRRDLPAMAGRGAGARRWSDWGCRSRRSIGRAISSRIPISRSPGASSTSACRMEEPPRPPRFRFRSTASAWATIAIRRASASTRATCWRTSAMATREITALAEAGVVGVGE